MRRVLVLALCASCVKLTAQGSEAAPARAPAQLEVTAEPPRVFLNTAAPTAPDAGRRVISVSSGDNLQAALDRAQPGDVIQLAKGASFTGNFILPNKNTTSASWIVIRPANFASLPAEGVRMTPSMAAALALPRIVTPNASNAIISAPGAHHYRLVGLDVSAAAAVRMTYALIGFDAGEAQRTVASIPHDLVLDRMFVHGTSTLALRRCVALNSASSAIIDSWLSDCHDSGSDSQAIAGWNGPGPYKIVNNYLEGAGENLMFGGADPAVRDVTPSDIEIRRNHFFKPLAWKKVWLVKNLLELKHAQRVLIEGNVFEHNWTHGQTGTALAFKSVNQNGACTWCVTQDVTVRLNLVRNVGSAVNMAGAPDNAFPTVPARRIVVMDNAFININTGDFDGDGRGFATFGSVSEVLIAHNTVLSPTAAGFVFGPAGSSVRFFTARDNIIGGGAYGITGDNFGAARALFAYAPGGRFAGNVLILRTGSAGYPSGNYYPTSPVQIGFANSANEDFRLAPNSPLKGRATDGRDPGADFDALNVAIQGVRLP